MKRVAICMTAVVFLLFNWTVLCFSETEKSAEDVMREDVLILEQEYIAAKKSRIFPSEKQTFQAQQPKSSSGNQQQKQVWELGTEISHITYKEPDVMEEKGMMYGIVGSYTYRGWAPPAPEELDKWMLKAEDRFSYGQVDYKNSGTLDNIDDYILEFRGLEGYDFSVFTASTLTPYIGIGYRYLNDDMSGKTSSTGAKGYERESNYIYSPIGVELLPI